jgi:hypothetical protein
VLQRRGVLYWVRTRGPQTEYAVVLHSYAPASTREVARQLELLDITSPAPAGQDIVLPVRLSAGSTDPGVIGIETRAPLDLLRLAAASIELPEDTDKRVQRFPESGPAGRGIRIRSAATRPAQARVATEYRGRWYYVDDEDAASKQWFTTLRFLLSARVQGAPTVAPMLTIPVAK